MLSPVGQVWRQMDNQFNSTCKGQLTVSVRPSVWHCLEKILQVLELKFEVATEKKKKNKQFAQVFRLDYCQIPDNCHLHLYIRHSQSPLSYEEGKKQWSWNTLPSTCLHNEYRNKLTFTDNAVDDVVYQNKSVRVIIGCRKIYCSWTQSHLDN